MGYVVLVSSGVFLIRHQDLADAVPGSTSIMVAIVYYIGCEGHTGVQGVSTLAHRPQARARSWSFLCMWMAGRGSRGILALSSSKRTNPPILC